MRIANILQDQDREDPAALHWYTVTREALTNYMTRSDPETIDPDALLDLAFADRQAVMIMMSRAATNTEATHDAANEVAERARRCETDVRTLMQRLPPTVGAFHLAGIVTTIGETYLFAGLLDEADRLFIEAQALQKQAEADSASPYPTTLLQAAAICRDRAKAAEARGDFIAAAHWFTQGITAISDVSLSDRLRVNELAIVWGRSTFNRELASVHLALGDPHAAHSAAEAAIAAADILCELEPEHPRSIRTRQQALFTSLLVRRDLLAAPRGSEPLALDASRLRETLDRIAAWRRLPSLPPERTSEADAQVAAALADALERMITERLSEQP